MSWSNPAPRRLGTRAVLALVAAAVALAFASSSAHAAFTLKSCQGTSTAGRGASFPQLLHNSGFWGAGFNSSAGCGATAGAPSAPTYNIATPQVSGAKSSGSGSGLGSCGAGQAGYPVGYRDPVVRFCATDDPATPTQLANMNAGNPATTADDGQIHQLPWAGGALIVIVHVPEGCTFPAPGASNSAPAVAGQTPMTGNTADLAAGAASTGDKAADQTTRPLISDLALESAFAGDPSYRYWGQLIPGLTGTATNAASGDNRAAGKDCAGTSAATDGIPIFRIVRSDSSGTTFNFKSYLSLVKNGPQQSFWMGNTSLFGSAQSGNALWPGWTGTNVATDNPANAASASTFICNNTTDYVCGGYKSGNDGIARSVEATNGSIGYTDIANARQVTLAGVSKPQQDFELTKTASPAVRDYTFWLPLQNNPDQGGGSFVEPTTDPTNHLNSGSGAVGSAGSNCKNLPALRNVPTAASSPNGDPTLGDWSNAIATGGAGYPICVLTYGLIWDDNASVYGNSSVEEGYARTVKDYVNFVASPFGQSLVGTDFSSTPTSLQSILQNGVNAIDWNKSAGGGGGGGGGNNGGGNNGGGGGGGGGGTTTTPAPGPAPAPAAPSNAFTLAGAKAVGRNIVLSVKLPGAGKVAVVSGFTYKKKKVSFATVSQSVTGGTGSITLKPSSKALAALKALSSKSTVTVNLEVTFTPTGGAPASKTAKLKVKGTKKAATKKKASKKSKK
jgi:ABC-type phosphate transport system substrate-binding protein